MLTGRKVKTSYRDLVEAQCVDQGMSGQGPGDGQPGARGWGSQGPGDGRPGARG